jgi:hypothetical protein
MGLKILLSSVENLKIIKVVGVKRVDGFSLFY